MGLLNDAIREHLELKRQHGADPSEVARLEGEALGPVVRGRMGEEPPILESYSEADQAGIEVREDISSAGSPVDLAPPGQETAELDMQSILSDGEGLPLGEAGRLGVDHTQLSTEESASDSLEWEVPDHSGREVAGDPVELDADHDTEDVLEETPDFLQETPEHERLWFEQQPPRDFDFDK
jgi:hypothetical protein